MTRRLMAAKIDEKRRPKKSSNKKDRAHLARESERSSDPGRRQQSLAKIFDDVFRTVQACSYAKALEELLPEKSDGKVEARVSTYRFSPVN